MKAGPWGQTGKLVSENTLEVTLMGFGDWSYGGDKLKGGMTLIMT